MTAAGFAVIDLETTGLFPGGHDRIVEIAVVHTDAHGTVTGAWETLVNPQRDLGPQRIHHIQSSQILDAPTFDQIAGQLVDLLRDRVVVAHNASFDVPFLLAELERAGVSMWQKPPTLCTMQLAREFLPGSGRALADCCDAYDIVIEEAHRASADAAATARLLESYILSSPMWDGWNEHLLAASAAAWPTIATPSAQWIPRPAATDGPPPHFLERITVKLPEHAGPAEFTDYLALLDRALMDRVLSVHEMRGLVELAELLGISRDSAVQLHHDYFDSVANAAWADGVLTEAEIADLCAVGDLLDIGTDALAAALEPRSASSAPAVRGQFELSPGDLIVLTGEMTRPRSEWERDLAFHGFTAWSAVTKKVRVVAAADPDSLSGKARKARDYGIPVVAESWLLERWPRCH
jgi:DNA polymerase-3 subunit epsilon